MKIGMKSTKCNFCWDLLHFARPVSKCQACAIVCHPKCADFLPNSCGLHFNFMQDFNKILEGWVQVPKNDEVGWNRRYLRLMDTMLCFFEDDKETDADKALIQLNFSSEVDKMVVTSAVSPTELPWATLSDVPYILKLEYIPHTTCLQEIFYIMTLTFDEKQKWILSFKDFTEKKLIEVDSYQENKLRRKMFTMKEDGLPDPICTCLLDKSTILLGAVDGLYVLEVVDKFTCSLKSKIDGLQYVYQIDCVKNIGLMILIQGNERRLTMTHIQSVQSAIENFESSSLASTPLSDIDDCHLFAVSSYHNEAPYICIATSKSVLLLQWDTLLKLFFNKIIFDTEEACSCILFTPKSVILGTDWFYEVDLSNATLKTFLDNKDPSFAGLTYGASQFHSFPVAIFLVSSADKPAEYLMCFHERGAFVNGSGQKTRTNDMKWSGLPLHFDYHSPYLFVMHSKCIEVVEIPQQGAIEPGLQAVALMENPQYMGPAHLERSVYLSSCHDQVIELLLIDGDSIGKSEFTLQHPNRQSLESTESYNQCGQSGGFDASSITLEEMMTD